MASTLHPFSRRERAWKRTPSALLLVAALLAGCSGAGPAVRTAPSPTDLSEARAAYLRQDFETAARLLLPLARRGDAEAQYALGYLHYYGLGVAPDAERARRWLQQAARGGHRKARAALGALDPQIPSLGASAPGRGGAEDGCRPPPALPSPPVQTSRRTVSGGSMETGSAARGPAALPAALPARPAPSPAPAARGADVGDRKIGTDSPRAGRYTVQLMGSRDRETLLKVVRSYGLSGAFYVEGEHQGGPWYRLFYGRYPGEREAAEAVRSLPGALRKSRPWVRELSTSLGEAKPLR